MENHLHAQQIIDHYGLISHPEGGFYKEVYRSALLIKDALPKVFNGNRNIATSIYFLLETGNFSAFHKIQSDETWHFYAGDTLNIYIIQTNGELNIIKLGSNLLAGEEFQFTVPAGCWFASRPATNSKFCFVGCTVYPGFDFNDFELAERNDLIALHPKHTGIIAELTR